MDVEERLAALITVPDAAALASLCAEIIADHRRLQRRTERIARISDGYQRELLRTNAELGAANASLESALNDVRTLRGFIPICSQCKKVRDDGGYWDEVETYISRHADTVVGSSVCPQCSDPPAPNEHVAVPALANGDEADAEQMRMQAILAEAAWFDHPLRSEYERLSLNFQKLARRLNKISRISDGFQTQLKHLNTTLGQTVRTDALTGLPNRRAMLERLEKASLDEAVPIAIAMIDIDSFKRVNDTFGHGLGDTVLCRLAELLPDMLREGDFAARWGGEEFLVLIHGDAATYAKHACEAFRSSFEAARVEHNGKQISCSVSIGLAAHDPANTFEETIRNADRALYAAKSFGRNSVVLADEF
jgi:diguanylate cyclase (GGDEF)-like protein